MNKCPKCGLEFNYDPKLHECRQGPRRLAGTWLDEVKIKQGVEWKENRRPHGVKLPEEVAG